MAAPHEKYKATQPALRQLEDAELYNLAEAIASLEEHPGFAALTRIMGDAREQLISDLINGETKSQADYARTSGFTAGMTQYEVAVETVREVAAERRNAAQQSAETARLERAFQESERAPDGISEPT